MPSIFTKIINGEVPSYKIFEDERTYAFLDIHPIQQGQVLVVPKVELDHIWDLGADDYQALWSTVQKVGKRLREVFPDVKRVGVIVEGFDVPHVHVKVFPVNSGDELRQRPDMTADPDHAELKSIAEKLAF